MSLYLAVDQLGFPGVAVEVVFVFEVWPVCDWEEDGFARCLRIVLLLANVH